MSDLLELWGMIGYLLHFLGYFGFIKDSSFEAKMCEFFIWMIVSGDSDSNRVSNSDLLSRGSWDDT